MRTPQVEPDWAWGIWNGHNVIPKPVDTMLDQPKSLASPLSWGMDIEDPKSRHDQEV